MPDGSKRNFSDENVVLKDLLTLTKTATQRLEQLLQRAKVHCQGVLCDEGRVDPLRLETHQVQAHGLAWLATYTESLRQMHNWAAALAAENQFSTSKKYQTTNRFSSQLFCCPRLFWDEHMFDVYDFLRARWFCREKVF